MVTADSVASPCTGVCTLDATRAYCLGCLRTLSEIGRWGSANETERRIMLAALAERSPNAGH